MAGSIYVYGLFREDKSLLIFHFQKSDETVACTALTQTHLLKMLARGSKIRLKRHSIDLLTQRTVIERMIRLVIGYVGYFQFAIFPIRRFSYTRLRY